MKRQGTAWEKIHLPRYICVDIYMYMCMYIYICVGVCVLIYPKIYIIYDISDKD